jgi:signal transduction histidine kinase
MRRADAIWTAAIAVCLTIALVATDAVEALYHTTRAHEDWDLDDIIVALISSIIAYALVSSISYRRQSRELTLALARLERAQDELLRNERLAALGQLTGTVSHELRNPLGTIRTTLFTVQEKLRDKGLGMERALARMERNIVRCDNIIGDLLDFTRAPAVARTPVDLDGAIAEELDELALPDGVAISLEPGSGARAAIDRERFRRVLINLVDNACQALTGDGPDANPDGEKTITVATRLSGGRAEIQVEDNGPGMAPEVLAKAFEPLFSTKSFGVGLGLATVKQIMEQHGGGVEIDSRRGEGTRVLLWLPTERQDMEAMA